MTFASEQEFITESELANRLDDPQATYESLQSLCASLEANTTVVVPSEENNTRYAMLWKWVKSEDGKLLRNALVTVKVPKGVHIKRPGGHWKTGSLSRKTNKFGFAVFSFKWDTSPTPKTKTIKITVSKDGYSTVTESMTIYGAKCCCWINCKCNTLSPIPSAPELSLMTPLVVSIGTSAYLLLRKKQK